MRQQDKQTCHKEEYIIAVLEGIFQKQGINGKSVINIKDIYGNSEYNILIKFKNNS